MGYVKARIEIKPHCENCGEEVKKCEYCFKDITKNKHTYCIDETFGGHCCTTKCYDEHKKHLELMKK